MLTGTAGTECVKEQDHTMAVPLVREHLRWVQSIWKDVSAALTRSAERNKRVVGLHRFPTPVYKVRQMVWLSSRDLPLQTKSRKLTPRFIGPFPVTKIINSTSVQLKLLRSLRIHPTFHVSLLKPVSTRTLSPPAITATPVASTTILPSRCHAYWMCGPGVGAFSSWWTGRVSSRVSRSAARSDHAVKLSHLLTLPLPARSLLLRTTIAPWKYRP
ncbi:uncharacterized protein LOC133487383 [Phyllopteryx taeniolatus]|uniref:uncharacterized protein LOC133487383 n=1 Tax=Phyllopteryx taeniolatus TaxID=161469 RepID=UPI002AD3F614|nr:uncharacterized protein LOC133487383 [Phyllopteryx taeniolatus]